MAGQRLFSICTSAARSFGPRRNIPASSKTKAGRRPGNWKSAISFPRKRRGGWVAVQDVLDTGQVETVYNFRVADYHTYFVGSTHWGFSVWVHNSYELDDVLRLSNQGIQNPRRLGASSKSLLGSEIHHIASAMWAT